MHPVLFEVFGRQIASYGVSILIGAAAAWLLVYLLGRRSIVKPDGKMDDNVLYAYLLCICGAAVGAFLLRPITRLPGLIINWDVFREMPIGAVLSLMFGEMVFYGGLLGGVAALLIYCKVFKINAMPIADLFAPGIALAHGVGRIGCFLGGCCYGAQVEASHPFAVRFPEASVTAPPHVPLLATQLIEAACLFLIAALLSIVYKKTAGKGYALFLYGTLYPVTRFVLEFYRGDFIRGVYGPFSTSQYISMAIFCGAVVFLIVILKRQNAIHSYFRE